MELLFFFFSVVLCLKWLCVCVFLISYIRCALSIVSNNCWNSFSEIFHVTVHTNICDIFALR